jgi:hypothetical protein
MIMREKWKIIEGYENYAVSTLGEVMNVKRGKKLKERIMASGYNGIALYRPVKQFRVHRLVARAFIPNPNHYRYVDHIDENKINNCVANLRWCTHQQNQQNITATKRKYQLPVGVHKHREKFMAVIHVNGKDMYLGCAHKTVESAEYARLVAERKYFKEFQPAAHLKRLLELEKKYKQ